MEARLVNEKTYMGLTYMDTLGLGGLFQNNFENNRKWMRNGNNSGIIGMFPGRVHKRSASALFVSVFSLLNNCFTRRQDITLSDNIEITHAPIQ